MRIIGEESDCRNVTIQIPDLIVAVDFGIECKLHEIPSEECAQLTL
jgi:hypothetical protein